MSSGEKISKDQLLAFLFKERNIEQFLQRDESSFLLPTFGKYMKDWFSDTTKSRRRLFSGQIWINPTVISFLMESAIHDELFQDMLLAVLIGVIPGVWC